MDNFEPLEAVSILEDESISVSQLNKLAKTLLENNMPVFWIKGEISGIRNYNHAYFDLKDATGKISCVLFAKSLAAVDFTLENGQQVEVRGRVTIYPQNGSYQINVERVRKVGVGELWEAYHRLLAKLKNEGLLDAAHKKPLPNFPKTVGVITSKEGSVIRDVITTLARRMPNIRIIVYHSAVQGVDAGMQLARAIKTANIRCEADVLIVCRGGGSMQDLWCFNEEVVAREVFASLIPIISAVGHETDTTIIDFVADLRAPTPTGAAELVAKSRNDWLNLLHKLHNQLQHRFYAILNAKKQQLDGYYTELKHLSPLNQLKTRAQFLIISKSRLDNAWRQIMSRHKQQIQMYQARLISSKINLSEYSNQVKNLENRLKIGFLYMNKNRANKLASLFQQLNLLNPENILSRGYAIVKNKQGKVVYSDKDVKMHERLEVTLKNGVISVIADKKHNPQQGELI